MFICVRDALASLRGIESDVIHGRQLISSPAPSSTFNLFLFYIQFIFMGFIDVIKRWRLANKGMSSGKKRRTSTASENAVVGSMQRSVWMKLLIYPVIYGFNMPDRCVLQI